MYDLVTERKTGDTTLFYCLHDTREEDLIADFSTHLQHNGDPSQKDHSILALLYNLITQAVVQQTAPAAPEAAKAFYFPVTKQSITPVYLVNGAPPPKTA